MKPKIIVLDLDGTLLNSDKKISKRNILALKEVDKAGIKLIFATARPPRVVKFTELDIKVLGSMIYYNGAYTECEKTSYKLHIGIDSKIGSEVLDYIYSLDKDADISVEIQDKWFSFKELNYMECNFMKTDHNPKIVDLEYIKSKELTKILITNFRYSSEIRRKYNNVLNIIETDKNHLIQIMNKEADKEKAVQEVVKKLGYSMKEVMCFGDDYNDLELFKVCGWKIAMENGINELKSIASEVTKTNDDDGVGIILERILANEVY